MKKTLIVLLLMVTGVVRAQIDSAAAVVDRYLALLNIEALPTDSMLYIETAVTTNQHDDTVWIYRWYAPPKRFRVEVRYNGKLLDGLVGDGEKHFIYFDAEHGGWASLRDDFFYEKLKAYDFRGPLYAWRTQGISLTWGGNTILKEQPMQVVKVDDPGLYGRYYMFDARSGLLTLIIETDELAEGFAPRPESRIEWKAMHEFSPIGTGTLLPTLESFLRGEEITVLSSTMRFLPIDPKKF